MGRRADGLYRDKFSAGERRALARAGVAPENAAPQVDGEIELLRILIRRLLGPAQVVAADNEAIGRMVDRIGRLLRTRQALIGRDLSDGDAARLDEMWEQVRRARFGPEREEETR